MAGAILENLSGRKLAILTCGLLLCQLTCFLIGGLVAPAPSNVQTILATKCIDRDVNHSAWFYMRGSKPCEMIHEFSDPKLQDDKITAEKIVFVFQMPLAREKKILDYSRWQQNLIGVLQVDVTYNKLNEIKEGAVMKMFAKLGYTNKKDPPDSWKEYAQSVEERRMDCTTPPKKREGHLYDCALMPMFELRSLHHDYYLLNVRLPVHVDKEINHGLGQITDMWLMVINQNGGFTKVWLSMKTVFFPIIVGILIWFWHRVRLLARPPALLEYMLLGLGISLTVLNLPLEYLSLVFDMPYMTLLSDIKQGQFYAMMLSFWLIFAGEHLMDDVERNHLRIYWKHLLAVAFGCLCLFVFDMCERGTQLRNPFYSIWVSDLGTNLALTFIIMAGISAGVYFIFLSYMIWKVFRNISVKRAALPSMSSMRRLHYEGIIYRFKFLMLATLLCAAMTVIGFILGQVSEGRWKWDEDIEMEYTSAFFTGVYGMWNIYIFSLIVLYSPSHKRWPAESDIHSSTGEEIEFSRVPTEPSEVSSLTAFAKKTAVD